MAIRVTLTGILADFWGADECFEDGGQGAIRELLQEDLSAMMEELTLKVEKVDEAAEIRQDRHDWLQP